MAVRLKERKAFDLAYSLTAMALCLCFYKTLDTGHRQSVTRVVARRDARVRDQQHGRAVRGQRPRGEKKTFFGDFLPFSKKLPAPWSGSFCSNKRKTNDKRHPPPPTPPPPAGEGEERLIPASAKITNRENQILPR